MYDGCMRKIFVLTIVIFFGFFAHPSARILAASEQAYKDYQYQFDLYRQAYSDFQVAKNEYQKFKSLQSQTLALEKTKLMLAGRDNLLRAYLLLLNEKLNETTAMSGPERQQYQTIIKSEVTFLESHARLIPSIGSLDDAVTVSKQLESHYLILQRSMRQTIIGISVGSLSGLKQQFDQTTMVSQALINASRGTFSVEKQATIDRWILQISNKKSLYQQKIDSINSDNTSWETSNLDEMNRKLLSLQQKLSGAWQELLEGSSFLTELVNTMRYID